MPENPPTPEEFTSELVKVSDADKVIPEEFYKAIQEYSELYRKWMIANLPETKLEMNEVYDGLSS